MKGKFGFFTSYEIEYVHNFLGDERIKTKLEELKNKPTMGIRFEDFLTHDTEYAYFSGKGVLWVLGLLLNWFNDLDLTLFLYEKSKNYNEDNYFIEGTLRDHWMENIKSKDRMIKVEPEQKNYWESQKLNPYWMEYHFFIHTIVQKLMYHRSDHQIDAKLAEIFQNYFDNSDQITARIKLDEIMWPTQGLANGIFMAMEDYFEEKDKNKIIQIREKAKEQGWRPFIFS
jgi:hypothetical protein